MPFTAEFSFTVNPVPPDCDTDGLGNRTAHIIIRGARARVVLLYACNTLVCVALATAERAEAIANNWELDGILP